MVDWSKTFDRQSHRLGVQSFIDNGVRPSLIPVLLSFFQERTMQVKWNNKLSRNRKLPGGGPQGDILGIIEYKSQSNDNTDFLDTDSKFKYIDPPTTPNNRCPQTLVSAITSLTAKILEHRTILLKSANGLARSR